MMLPLALILLGVASAFAVACGTTPQLARHWHGLQIIMAARQLRWPLVALSLAMSIALLGLVISESGARGG